MRRLFDKFTLRLKALPPRAMLSLLSLLVGLLCGLAAVLLKTLVASLQHLLTSSPLVSGHPLLMLALPGTGMLIAWLTVRFVVRDDIGHGVTKVLYAVSRKESRIKGHNTWSSILTSAVTIGFGGSVGAEAPIVYAGAAFGSNVAKILGLSYQQMTLLLGCGAAGAVAGIFQAPLAGVLFTLEILLFNISMSSILPLLISTVTASVTSMLILGNDMTFAADISRFAMANIPYYLILGLFCGLMSLYFIRTTLLLEDTAARLKRPLVRWGITAAVLGLLIYLFPPLFGEGYGSVNSLLNNNIAAAAGNVSFGGLVSGRWSLVIFFALVMFLKVFSMSLTNAGGGVGGTFGPTLFVGAMAGFIVARVINLTAIGTVPEANFVLAGMGGLMAGVMQAPLTAIFLIAEITGGYDLLIPLIITSTISYATIRPFEQYSIYTKRIAKKGDLLTHDNDKAVLMLLRTSDLLETGFEKVDVNGCLADVVDAVKRSDRSLFPVVDASGHFQAVIFLNDIRSVMFDRDRYRSIRVTSLMKGAPALVYIDENMESVMRKFEATDAWNLPVIDRNGIYFGFVSRSRIFSSYRSQLKEVSHD